MSIYSRDNIAYQSMIDNMINNRLKTMERKSNRIQKEADIASDTAKGLASTFARGMDYEQAANEQKDLENKLKELEARRDYIRSQNNFDSAKDQWLLGHPDMTEEDYEQFVAYQNSLFGGR